MTGSMLENYPKLKDYRILVLGSCNVIGRNIINYLVENDIFLSIQSLDKSKPSLTYMSKGHLHGLRDRRVTHLQANLDTKETTHHLINVAKTCPTLKRLLFFSTAEVYAHKKGATTERDSISPRTTKAKYMIKAEELLLKSGLPVFIFRLPFIYGPGESQCVSSLIAAARVYYLTSSKLRTIICESTKCSHIHVRDICRAACHVAALDPDNIPFPPIYNLSGDPEMTLHDFLNQIRTIFGINIGVANPFVMHFAKSNLKIVVEYANTKHLNRWILICRKYDILSTPITPQVFKEYFQLKDYSIDGSAITRIGFKYLYPSITADLVKEQIDYWIKLRAFPPFEIKGEPIVELESSESTKAYSSSEYDSE